MFVCPKSFRRFLILETLRCSPLRSQVVRILGSCGQSTLKWPLSLQHMHLSRAASATSSSGSPSVRSWIASCLPYLHPTSKTLVFPQHHHMVPLYSDWCTRQLQLKLSYSWYSWLQRLHILTFCRCPPPFKLRNFVINFLFLLNIASYRRIWLSNFSCLSSSSFFAWLSSRIWRSLLAVCAALRINE